MTEIPTVHADRVVHRYWMAIPDDARAAIEDATTEAGALLRMTAGHPGRPGTATVRLLRDGRLVAQRRGRLTAETVWAVVRGVRCEVCSRRTDVVDAPPSRSVRGDDGRMVVVCDTCWGRGPVTA